jgi:hypothetical protein
MNRPLNINGIDLPVTALKPLGEREAVNTKGHKGYLRIRASIKAVGLIEPLSVYAEGESYLILDGYLRYLACRELRIASVPCIVYPEKDAYTFNRMVSRLSGYQEMRMLRKSLETLDEQTIANVFGMKDHPPPSGAHTVGATSSEGGRGVRSGPDRPDNGKRVGMRQT